jgi:hypothetical protein
MPHAKQLGQRRVPQAGDTTNQRSNMYLKIISVIAIAIAALALGATTALAEEFTAKEYPANITSKATTAQEFSIGEASISCSEAAFTGELAKASSELDVAPGFGGCKATIGGLHFDVLFSILEIAYFSFKIHSLFKWLLSVLGNDKITFKIEVRECAVSVPVGQLLEGVSGENASGKIKVTAAVTGIKQENTCGLGTGTADYKGKVEVSATNSKGEADAIEA